MNQIRTLRFDEFMERALYDPERGFFAASGEAGGARGDFITSPEVGPLFGLLVSRFLDRCWDRAGRPERFDVVEFAAGRGALALAIRAAQPTCAAALRYHLVERSERLRERQREHLPVVLVGGADPVQHSGALEGTDPAAATTAAAGPPGYYSHADATTLPPGVQLVLANELLDNLPVRLCDRTPQGWSEVHVTAGVDAASGPGEELREELRPVADEVANLLDRLVPDATPGARVPLQQRAGEWLAAALTLVGLGGADTADKFPGRTVTRDDPPARVGSSGSSPGPAGTSAAPAPTGTVLVIDYCRNSPEMAALAQHEWLRTYRGHNRGGSPLEAPGSQDITCDVAPDQLALVRAPARQLSQAGWLAELGIAELVAEGRALWQAKAAAPDLAALRARSRIGEAEALTDPEGLGGFGVLIWE